MKQGRAFEWACQRSWAAFRAMQPALTGVRTCAVSSLTLLPLRASQLLTSMQVPIVGLYCPAVIAPNTTSNYSSVRWVTADLPPPAGGDGDEASAAETLCWQRDPLGVDRSDALSMTHVLTLLAG